MGCCCSSGRAPHLAARAQLVLELAFIGAPGNSVGLAILPAIAPASNALGLPDHFSDFPVIRKVNAPLRNRPGTEMLFAPNGFREFLVAEIPSSAQRLVQLHDRRELGAPGLGKGNLRREEQLLGLQDLEIAGPAGGVALGRDLDRLAVGPDRALLLLADLGKPL